MWDKKTAIILANFGGPRDLQEVRPFLESLLTDPDVIRTKLPSLLQNFLFKKIAKRRSKKVAKDYLSIGGKSPIFEHTETLAKLLSEQLDTEVIPFSRYLPSTHRSFWKKIKETHVEEFRVFPLFPQFCYATTGSAARFFMKIFPQETLNKFRWVKSYAGHPSFIHAYTKRIQEFLEQQQLDQKDTILLFSAHGVPQKFIDKGDIYQSECELSYHRIIKNFPDTLGKLSYQSKFGPGKWITPYTPQTCRNVTTWNKGRKHFVFVPISFTSDHIETLFEIEQLYLPMIEKRKLIPHRCPALNLHSEWINAIIDILKDTNTMSNQMLIRP